MYFIELIFGISPDRGTGAFELMLVAVLGRAVALLLAHRASVKRDHS